MLNYGWGDEEHAYLVLTIEGKWTSDEFAKAIKALSQLAEENSHSLSLLVDLRHSANPPMDILGRIGSALHLRACNIQHLIVISERSLWKRLYETLEKVYQVSYPDTCFVDSVDKAYQGLVAATST